MDSCAVVVAYSSIALLVVAVILKLWCSAEGLQYTRTRDQYRKRMGSKTGLWDTAHKENYEVQAYNQCNIQGAGAPAAFNTCGTDDLANVEPARNVRFLRAPNGCDCNCSCPYKPGSRLGIVTDMSLSEICPYHGSPKVIGNSY